jgi:hypothetical protein
VAPLPSGQAGSAPPGGRGQSWCAPTVSVLSMSKMQTLGAPAHASVGAGAVGAGNLEEGEDGL